MRADARSIPMTAQGGLVTPWAAARPAEAGATSAEGAGHWITRWTLYLYVFWIPLEYPDRTLPFDAGTLVGAIFLATTVFSPRTCFRTINAPLVWFFAFFWAWCLSFVLGGGMYKAEVWQAFLRLLQLLLIFWASCNLMRTESTAQGVLVTLLVATVGLALLQVTGVANATADFGGGVHRATVLGQNPNRTSRFLAAGALIAVGLSYGRAHSVIRPRILAWLIVPLLAVAMIQGGSRGSLLALALGMMMFALAGSSLRVKIRNGVVGVLVLAVIGFMAMQSPLMQRRMQLAEGGNLAGREYIFPIAARMVVEQPLFGWGGIRNQFELGSRLPENDRARRDTHNLGLELMTSTGLVGTIPFLIGMALCGFAAWRARRGEQGVLPMAMMALVLVGNLSGNFLVFKLYWVMLAFAVASAATFEAGRRQRRAMATAMPDILPHAMAGSR